MKRPIVYIAGPFSGASAWEIECNVRYIEGVCLEVWSLGATGIAPHLNSRHFFGTLPESVWIEGYLQLLERCDVLLLVGAWIESSGSMREKKQAEEDGMLVLVGMEEFRAWMTGTKKD